MFGGGASGAGTLTPEIAAAAQEKNEDAAQAMVAAAKEDGPVLTPPAEMGILPPALPNLPLKPTLNPVVSVQTAPMKLAKQLGVMRTELVSRVNEGELKREVEGFSFEDFDEKAVAVRYVGVALYNAQYPEGDLRREPYKKICTDLTRLYSLPEDVMQNMLNAELAREAHQVHYEFKFTKGKPGHFYFGKFMAVNTKSEIDMILLFYRLDFKINPDTIVHEYAHKFLWWTTHTTYSTTLKEVVLTEKEKNKFQDYFRLKMYKELSEQIRAFELEDESA